MTVSTGNSAIIMCTRIVRDLFRRCFYTQDNANSNASASKHHLPTDVRSTLVGRVHTTSWFFPAGGWRAGLWGWLGALEEMHELFQIPYNCVANMCSKTFLEQFMMRKKNSHPAGSRDLTRDYIGLLETFAGPHPPCLHAPVWLSVPQNHWDRIAREKKRYRPVVPTPFTFFSQSRRLSIRHSNVAGIA